MTIVSKHSARTSVVTSGRTARETSPKFQECKFPFHVTVGKMADPIEVILPKSGCLAIKLLFSRVRKAVSSIRS